MRSVSWSKGWASAAVVVFLAGALAGRAQAFGLLVQVRTAAAYPEPYAGIIAEQPGAFLVGSAFADLERLPDLPPLLWRAYRLFNPADDYTPFAHSLHDPGLALDLLQRAQTPAERAFAIGYVGNVAGEMVLEQLVMPRRLYAAGSGMWGVDTARWLVRLMAEWQTPADVRAEAMAAVRTVDPETWLFFYDVVTSEPWRETLSPEAYQVNVALLLRWLETQVAGAGPGGGIESALGWASRLIDTDGLLAPEPLARDVAWGVSRTAAVAQRLMERGAASLWMQERWAPESPYPQFAAWQHWAIDDVRTRTADGAVAEAEGAQPEAVPWIVQDAFFTDGEGRRLDAINPTHASWHGEPIAVRAVVRVYPLAPLEAEVALEVWEDRSDDRLRQRDVQRVSFTVADAADGRVLEWVVPFELDPAGEYAPGGLWDDVTDGFYLRVWGHTLAPEVDGHADLPVTESCWFSSYTPFALRLRGCSTYGAWPYSLRRDTRLAEGFARDADGDLWGGSINESAATDWSADNRAAAAYRFPYAAIALPSRSIALEAADGTRLEATLYRAQGACRAVIGVAGWRSNRGAFAGIARRLQEEGVTFLALNVRGQGFSGSDGDYQALRSGGDEAFMARLPQDVAAAWDYLVQEEGVAPAQIAMLGAEAAGWLAAMTSADRPFAGLAWLTPVIREAWPEGLAREEALPRSLWVAGDEEAAPMIRHLQEGAAEGVEIQATVVEGVIRSGRGVQLLGTQPELVDGITAYFLGLLPGWDLPVAEPRGSQS